MGRIGSNVPSGTAGRQGSRKPARVAAAPGEEAEGASGALLSRERRGWSQRHHHPKPDAGKGRLPGGATHTPGLHGARDRKSQVRSQGSGRDGSARRGAALSVLSGGRLGSRPVPAPPGPAPSALPLQCRLPATPGHRRPAQGRHLSPERAGPGSSHDPTHPWRLRARPRHGPRPEVPPRKLVGGRALRGTGGLSVYKPRPFRSLGLPRTPSVVMAAPASRQVRRRARAAPRPRSAEDWWWDRLAPRGSGYHLLQSDSMLLVLSEPGPARPRAQRRASRRTPRQAPPGPSAAAKPKAGLRPEAAAAPAPAPAPTPTPEEGPDAGWGDRIPLEILVQIFGLLVAADGPMPFLGR